MDQKTAFQVGLPLLGGMVALVAVGYLAPNLLGGGFIILGVALLLLALAVAGFHGLGARSDAAALKVLPPVVLFPLLAVLCLFANVGGLGMAFLSHATGGNLERDGMHFGRADDGHFRPVLDINGVPVNFVVDTEARHIVLSPSDARRVGFEPSTMTFGTSVDGPDGPQPAAAITLKTVVIGHDTSIADVPALVVTNELAPNILGRDFFDRTRGWAVKDNTLIVLPPGIGSSVTPMTLLLALSGAGILIMLVQVAMRGRPSAPLRDALYPLAGLIVAAGVGFHQEVGAVARSIYDYAMTVGSGSEGMRIGRADGLFFFVKLTINGNAVEFMVDPQMPINTLRPDVPKQIGINPSSLVYNEQFAVTTGGVEYAANVVLPQAQLGDTIVKDLQLKVFATDRLKHNILGKPFLDSFKYWRVDDDALILRQ